MVIKIPDACKGLLEDIRQLKSDEANRNKMTNKQKEQVWKSLQKHFKGSLPIEDDDWQIGIIVGRSGSGKSSIAKKLFPTEYITSFEYQGKCILDDFPQELSTSEITYAMQRRFCFSTGLAEGLQLS